MVRRPKQAKFVSLNLRLPPELHRELVKAAGSASSLNSEIIRRLQGSFDVAETLETVRKQALAEVEKHLSEEKRLSEERMKRHREDVSKLIQELGRSWLLENERGGDTTRGLSEEPMVHHSGGDTTRGLSGEPMVHYSGSDTTRGLSGEPMVHHGGGDTTRGLSGEPMVHHGGSDTTRGLSEEPMVHHSGGDTRGLNEEPMKHHREERRA
jgi:Arc-like DNA binding domain